MEYKKRLINKFVMLLIAVLIVVNIASAVQDLFALQGKVTEKSGGATLNTGNVTVEIWDNATGGTLIFNSTSDFNESVKSGFYDIVVGAVSELALNLSDVYYLDIAVDSEDVDWGDDERRQFQSSVGNETGRGFLIGQDL